MPTERSLTIPGRYASVPEAMDFVVQAAEEAGLDDTARFHCKMAADEACTNIIEHAYGGEEQGEIRLTARIEPGVLTIRLVDSGSPFDPASVQPPAMPDDPAEVKTGGLGLHIMRQVMDEVTFTFGEEHNEVVLVKRGSPTPPE